ncbi:hypothetical protein P3G55_11875 [Leptospira sp. 96542]|nr:hypothetical protein [Leptospira sp. 96542]
MYHLQFSYEDEIFHIVREPWSKFRFQYGVVQNRNIIFYEWDIGEDTKLELKRKWNEAYLVQKKHIDNLQVLERTEKLYELLQKSKNFSIPISGLGYFSSIKDDPITWKSIFDMDSSQMENLKIKIEILDKNIKQIEDDLRQKVESEEFSFENLGEKNKHPYLLPTSRIQTNFQTWEIYQRKRFVREFAFNPKLIVANSFYQFSETLSENEISKLEDYKRNLINEIKLCFNQNNCDDWEELTLLIRIVTLKESIQTKKILVPIKSLNQFSYLPPISIPKWLRKSKKEEYKKLLLLNKNSFFKDGYSSISFLKWENFLTNWMHFETNATSFEYDDWSFQMEGFTTNQATDAKQVNIDDSSKNLTPNISPITEIHYRYKQHVRSIYSYHLVFQNCTNEIFKYQSFMFPDSSHPMMEPGLKMNTNTLSFNFIPAIVANKMESSPKTKFIKIYPSYRNLKRLNLNFSEKLKESFIPTSKIYSPNPLDPSFLFFTEDSIVLRPVMGLANLFWGAGYFGVGVIVSPFDRGENVSKGLESLFNSLPELVFFNIRKGHFPFITEKDIPKTYYELDNQ